MSWDCSTSPRDHDDRGDGGEREQDGEPAAHAGEYADLQRPVPSRRWTNGEGSACLAGEGMRASARSGENPSWQTSSSVRCCATSPTREATVWVETDGPCERRGPRPQRADLHVAGHHYALVVLEDLEPGSTMPYEVAARRRRCWPPPDDPYPPCVIRTHTHDESLRLAFGSCRVSVPHTTPYVLSKDDDQRGREVDALLALVERMRHEPSDEWPDALLLLGDQVYADEVSPETKELIAHAARAARPADRRGRRLRGVHGAVPRELVRPGAALAAVDGLQRDDLRRPRRPRRLEHLRGVDRADARQAVVGGARLGAYMSYWIYQHIGNLSPAPCTTTRSSARCRRPRGLRGAAARLRAQGGARGRRRALELLPRLRPHAPGRRRLARGPRADRGQAADAVRRRVGVGRATLQRRLRPPRHRHVAAGHAGGRDAPPRGVERGRLRRRVGRAAARLGERIRQGLDLEHWPAFEGCFRRMAVLLEDVAAGRRGRAPATVVLLSGDVHHAYLAEAWFPGRDVHEPRAAGDVLAGAKPARQARAPCAARGVHAAGGGVRARPRTGGRRRQSPMRWSFAQEPTFDNQVAQLDLHGRDARAADREDRARGLAGAEAPLRPVARDRAERAE